MCPFPAVSSRVGEEGVASLCYLTTLSLEDGDGLLIEFERPGCGENVLGMLFEWWWGLMYSRGGVTCCLSPDSDPVGSLSLARVFPCSGLWPHCVRGDLAQWLLIVLLM